MQTRELWGVVGSDGELVYASELNTQVGLEFDGPALWNDRESAEMSMDDVGGLDQGSHISKVTISWN